MSVENDKVFSTQPIATASHCSLSRHSTKQLSSTALGTVLHCSPDVFLSCEHSNAAEPPCHQAAFGESGVAVGWASPPNATGLHRLCFDASASHATCRMLHCCAGHGHWLWHWFCRPVAGRHLHQGRRCNVQHPSQQPGHGSPQPRAAGGRTGACSGSVARCRGCGLKAASAANVCQACGMLVAQACRHASWGDIRPPMQWC